MQWFLLFFILSDVVNCNTRDLVVSEVDHLSRLVPLKTEAYVMFWRPQKVGSSTILSFLISYAFRYNLASKRRGFANSFCWKLMVCLSHSSYSTDKNLMKHHEINNAEVKLTQDFKERQSEKLIYSMSWSHQICNLPSYLVQSSLPCGFAKDFNYINSLGKNNSKSDERHISFSKPSFPLPNADNIKELFVVRDPLSRMISVYYFWGELFRLRMTMSAPIIPRMMNNIGKIIDNRINGKGPNIVRIGTKLDRVEVIKGHLFDYHGNESSAPDEHIAMRFASNLPLKPGMPGPSYSWSAISDNYKDAVNELKKDRIMTIITERLDESLVVTSNYMNWSLADVIVVKNRKALSTHPKHTQWPAKSIEIMKASLHKSGEYAIYDAANKKLQDRITVLEKQGISVKLQVKLLQEVRRRVSQVNALYRIKAVYFITLTCVFLVYF